MRSWVRLAWRALSIVHYVHFVHLFHFARQCIALPYPALT